MKTEPDPEYGAGAKAFRDGELFDHTQSYQWRLSFRDAVTFRPVAPLPDAEHDEDASPMDRSRT